MTQGLKKQILKSQDSDSLKEFALTEGFSDLNDQALRLAEMGITTIEEVLSVTKMNL